MIALKMAQILESQGILVTVTLLEADPEFLTGWAERFLLNYNFKNKLDKMYSPVSLLSRQFNDLYNDNEFQSNTMPDYHEIFKEKTHRALNLIWSLLRTSLESKPLSNKLLTKMLIYRYKRKFEFDRTNLNNYCINPLFLYIIPKQDYRSVLEDKKTVEAITKNVTQLYPLGIELPLSHKYKHYYYNVEKIFSY